MSTKITDTSERGVARLTRPLKLPAPVAGFLLLSALITLLWSHVELLWSDEFGILYTDSVSSFARLWAVQRATPISLDPIAYHLLAHSSIDLIGSSAFAIRLPSMLGYLMMQICLFFYVSRAANRRAGTFAVGLSTLTGAVFYAGQGRPYGVLLGFCGLILFSWQAAARKERSRGMALATLAVATILALNSHYYAILLLVPLFGAELCRSLQRRCIDFPVWGAILCGTMGSLLTLPFVKGAAAFQGHYYNRFAPDLHAVTYSYLWLTTGTIRCSNGVQHAIEAALVLLTLTMIVSAVRQVGRGALRLPAAEFVFLLLIAGLPVFGYALGILKTHIFETRYVLSSAVGINALLGIGLAAMFDERKAPIGTAILFLLAFVAGVAHIRMEQEQRKTVLATVVLSEEATAALASRPSQPIYVINPDKFFLVRRYAPNADARSRLALFYSQEQDIRSSQSDTMTLTSMHLRAMTEFRIEPYEEISKEGGEHLFVLDHGGDFNWPDRALSEAHANIRHLGEAFGGELVAVRFE